VFCGCGEIGCGWSFVLGCILWTSVATVLECWICIGASGATVWEVVEVL
jgi:hypothetical protein